jgi:acetyl esterase/lipase
MAMYPITDPLGTFFCQDEVDSSHKIHAAAIRRFLDPNGPVVSNSQGTDRDNFYRWVVSEGNYAKLLGLELRFLQYGNYGNESWRISKQIPAYGLPPTYVCHGTKDVDVGVEQSDEVVGALAGAGIDVKYENMREMGHMFDVKGDLAMDAMYEFMLKYL